MLPRSVLLDRRRPRDAHARRVPVRAQVCLARRARPPQARQVDGQAGPVAGRHHRDLGYRDPPLPHRRPRRVRAASRAGRRAPRRVLVRAAVGSGGGGGARVRGAGVRDGCAGGDGADAGAGGRVGGGVASADCAFARGGGGEGQAEGMGEGQGGLVGKGGGGGVGEGEGGGREGRGECAWGIGGIRRVF